MSRTTACFREASVPYLRSRGVHGIPNNWSLIDSTESVPRRQSCDSCHQTDAGLHPQCVSLNFRPSLESLSSTRDDERRVRGSIPSSSSHRSAAENKASSPCPVARDGQRGSRNTHRHPFTRFCPHFPGRCLLSSEHLFAFPSDEESSERTVLCMRRWGLS